MNLIRKFAVSALFVASNLSGKAQKHTYIGLEGALCNDIYVIRDEGSNLEKVPLSTGLWGLNVRKEVNDRIFVEFGVLAKAYWEGFGFKGIPVWGSNQAFLAVLIPTKVGYQMKIGNHFHLVPAAGVTIGVNTAPDIGAGGGRGMIRSNRSSIEYQYSETNLSQRYFIMLRPSLGLERPILKSFIVSINLSRTFGFNRVNDLDISYTIDGSAPVKGKGTSRGDYWSADLALRYRISDLWK